MVNRQLARIPGDHARYALEGVGTLRLEGVSRGRATAEAAGRHWYFARRGFWRQLQATDAAGVVVGAFERRLLGGGTVRWADREFALRRASVWRERYVLADGDRELALLDAKGWGRRPVTISIDDHAALDPGLVLYTAFVVHTLAGDATAGAVAATTAVTASSS
jgi:hypothetical protein